MDVDAGTLTAKGTNGTVTFDGRTVTIRRGWLSNHAGGERTIPVSRITGVEVTAPSILQGAGAFTIHVPGASEARTLFGNGKRNNRRNENSVEFNSKKRLREFEAVRDAILAAL